MNAFSSFESVLCCVFSREYVFSALKVYFTEIHFLFPAAGRTLYIVNFHPFRAKMNRFCLFSCLMNEQPYLFFRDSNSAPLERNFSGKSFREFKAVLPDRSFIPRLQVMP